MENKKVIGVAQVLQHLKDGMTRDDIAEHYSITKSECKLLFQDERLKGKKTIKKPSFIIVEDATAEIPLVEEEIVTTDKVSPPETEEEGETKESFGTNTTDEVEVEDEKEEVVETAKATWD